MSTPYQMQYARITQNLINNPTKIGNSRIGKINSRFCEQMRIDLSKEFPLQDIKTVKSSNIVHELIWMLRGDTNIKYLIENGCHIWTDDAYRYYNEKYTPLLLEKYSDINQLKFVFKLSKKEFIEKILKEDGHPYIKTENTSEEDNLVVNRYIYGDLDRVYGQQWRNFNGKTDQLQKCIETLKTNPDDRRMIVTAHNPTDIEDKNVGLPSCHNYFQFYTVELSIDERKTICEETLGLTMSDEDDPEEYLNNYNIPKRTLSTFCNIRSNDWFLGQPYNAAQYALLTHIVANIVGMKVGELVINSVDAHLYHVHFDAAQTWLDRYEKIGDDNYVGEQGLHHDWFELYGCKVNFKLTKPISKLDEIDESYFNFSEYESLGFIKAPLLT